MVDFCVKLFEQQQHMIANRRSAYSRAVESYKTNKNFDFICALIIETSFSIHMPLTRLLQTHVNLRFKCINLLIKSLNCLNEWKSLLKQLNFVYINDIFAKITVEICASKYLPSLDQFNWQLDVDNNDRKNQDMLMLIEFFSIYFDLIVDNNDEITQNLTQIEYLNVKFLHNLANYITSNQNLNHLTYKSYLLFLIRYLKLRQSIGDDIESIQCEFVQYLFKLLNRFSGKFSQFIELYHKFMQITIGQQSEYDEAVFSLLFCLYRNCEESEYLFEFFDSSLRLYLNNRVRYGLMIDYESVKAFYVIVDCFMQTYGQLKRKYSSSKEIVEDIRLFLNKFVCYSCFLQTNSNDFELFVSKYEGFGLDFYKTMQSEATNDKELAKIYEELSGIIEIDAITVEIVELKLKFLLYWLNKTQNSELLNKIVDLLEQSSSDKLIEMILNNEFVYENAFKEDLVTKFLISLLKFSKKQSLYENYLSKIIGIEQLGAETIEFISKIRLDKSLFAKIIDLNEFDSEYFVNISLENQEYLFNDQNLFEICFKKLISCLRKMNYELNNVDTAKFDEFLLQLFTFKPLECVNIIKETLESHKNYKKFFRFSENLTRFNSLLTKLCDKDFEIIVETSDNKQNGVNGECANGTDGEDFDKKYTFTLSKENQQLLIQKYKQDSNETKTFEWLKYAGDLVKSKDSTLKNSEIKMSDFIEDIINDKKMDKSIEKFPLTRKLSDLDSEIYYQLTDFDQDHVYLNDIYDPIYLLPNLYSLLDYGNVVDITQFTQSKCLSYILVALSSKCDNLRAIAYASFYKYKSHLESASIFCKNFLNYLIKLIRNSIEKQNQKLPFVVAYFLSQIVPILIQPGTPLYKPLVSFLLLKPTLDLTNVPEFYKLFNSSSMQYKIERKWMVDVLKNGIRTRLDYHLYEKRFIYRQLLSIYESKFCDIETKLNILELIKATCCIKYALIDLIRRHYLILWLTGVINNELNDEQTITKSSILFTKSIEIYLFIWKQLTADSTPTSPPPFLFLNQMFVLMGIIINKLDKVQLSSIVDSAHSEEKTNELSNNSNEYVTNLYRCLFKTTKELVLFLNNSMPNARNVYKLNEHYLNCFYKIAMQQHDIEFNYHYCQLLVNNNLIIGNNSEKIIANGDKLEET